ncbi:MAG TPA: hypothetical protein VFA68_07645 [Terriglobales bacterium]|nr:hypothetical protein [Terriglobales bacterium]
MSRRGSGLLLFVALVSFSGAFGQSSVTPVQLTFTTIDVPGAAFTGIYGINSFGDMVGNYGWNTNSGSHGFLYRNGTFIYFDYPGQNRTFPTGINDSGLIVGSAGNLRVVGFLFDGATFTPIRKGNDSATFSFGINNAEDIVGGAGTVGSTTAFKLRSGTFKDLMTPGQNVYAYATGINNLGQIVGWTDYDGFQCRGNQCQTIDFPGAAMTEAEGINDSGIVVGWYNPSSSTDFAFAFYRGKYISFSVPSAAGTYALGINASGQIVGEYTFDHDSYHGFVTSPISSTVFDF